MSRYYLADFESQRGTGPLSTTNCAAASGAMLTDQATLGLKDPGVRFFRRLTDDTEGGLRMGQVAAAMDEFFGLEVRCYDNDDRLKWWQLVRYLERGWFAVVAGDYDVLPPDQRGADYDGFHAVVYHQRFTHNQRVGDPLRDRWVKWPNDLAYRYVKKFDEQVTGGIHAVVMIPRYAKLRSEVRAAEVRAEPSQSAEVIGVLRGSKKLVTGGTVRGDSILGIDRWRKVWTSSGSGYLHWTVSWQA